MKNLFCAKTDDISNLFNTVSFAAATRTEVSKSLRDNWCRSIEVMASGSRLRFTATNKYRMSTAFIDVDSFESNKHSDFKCTVLADDLRFAFKSFKGSKELMLFTSKSDVDGTPVIRITDNRRTIEISESDEEFKNWHYIISTRDEEPMALLLDRKKLLRCLNSLLSGVKLFQIKQHDRTAILDVQTDKVVVLPTDELMDSARLVDSDTRDGYNHDNDSIQRLSHGKGYSVEYNESDHFMSGKMQISIKWFADALEAMDTDMIAFMYGDRSVYNGLTMYEKKVMELLQTVKIVPVEHRFDLTESPTVHLIQPMRVGERRRYLC